MGLSGIVWDMYGYHITGDVQITSPSVSPGDMPQTVEPMETSESQAVKPIARSVCLSHSRPRSLV